MCTLFFNSNYLDVIIPDAAEAALIDANKDELVIRCVCFGSWPVTKLNQEWGIDAPPGAKAKWTAIYYAIEAPSGFGDPNNPHLHEGEHYWIALHPSTAWDKAIALLCSIDHKRFFFAVATEEEEKATASLIAWSQLDNVEVWIPVIVRDFDVFYDPEIFDQAVTFARVVVRGEKIADWTKATIVGADL